MRKQLSALLLNPLFRQDHPLLIRSLWLYTLYRGVVLLFLLLVAAEELPQGAIWLYGATLLLALPFQLLPSRLPPFGALLHLLGDFLLLSLQALPFYPVLLAFFALHAALFLSLPLGLLALASLLFTSLLHTRAPSLLLTHGAGLLLFFSGHLLTRSQQRASETLSLLEELCPLIAKHSRLGIVVLRGRDLLFMNPQARKLLGLEGGVEGLPEEVAALLEGERGELRSPKGLRLTRQEAGEAVLIFVEDETHYQKRLREEQLALLGRISSAIAHEIRNPLSSILQASQLLKERFRGDEEAVRLVALIERGCRRIGQAVDTIYQIHSRRSSRRERLELTGYLRQFARELLELFPQLRRIPFSLSLPKTPLWVQVDPSQLHQILINLCQNALEHGQNPKAPGLELRLSRVGNWAFLEVVDFGKGIPRSLQEEVFEPFFTTSPKGKGLGLYLVRELARRNGIHLEYLPNPKGGSIFRLGFKLAEGKGE